MSSVLRELEEGTSEADFRRVSDPFCSAWDDIYDVFGNGDDYDWALEGEEEMMGGAVEGEQPRMEDVSRLPPPVLLFSA